MEPFPVGQCIVVRDMIWGRPFVAWPQRVLADDGDELAVLLRPGVRGIAPTLWVEALRTGVASLRNDLLDAYARRNWALGAWTWQRTTRVSLLRADRYFAVSPMWDERGTFLCWYVNFQAPYRRTAIGVDTSDLHVDLLVAPDFSYRWKDEDEYAHARRLGLVTDACHKRVEEAREEAVALVEQRGGPFAGNWPTWAADPSWPLHELPDGWLDEPCAPHLLDLPG